MATSKKAARLGFGATMAEVAALAGVTKMTVSRVVRQPEKVNAETRRRVSEAMTALGFYPRLQAAGFGHLGVIIDNDAKCSELLSLLDGLFATGRREDWIAKLRGADIVSAPINTLLEASNDPDVMANGYVTHVEHPKHGRLKVHGTPWQFSETPARPGIAPELGEHNDAVLGELGYSPAELAALRARKII